MIQPPMETPPEDKKLEPVITNAAVRRKQPLGRRFMHTFFGGTAKSAAQYVMMEVLLPAAKDAVADAFSQGVERMLFGEVRSASRRGIFRAPSGPTNFTPYNRMSGTPAIRAEQRYESRALSPQARATHNFDEILLATRPEALAVLQRLEQLIIQYGNCSVADLYAITEISSDYTDNKYGWTSLHGADVIRVRGGYLLDLPRPEQLS